MTNTFLFANASTNLAAALAASPSATTLVVITGTGSLFPNPTTGQQFALTLRSQSGGVVFEIVYVTGVTGDSFTVLRGQEGTVAQAWNVGDIVLCGPTAGQMQAMQQSSSSLTLSQIQAQSGNWANDTGSANAMVVSLSPAPASQAALKGVPIRVLKSSTNTGAVTLDTGFGAKPVLISGTALSNGQLPGGSFLTVIYDGVSSYDLQSIAYPPNFGGDSGSGGTAGLVPAPPAGSTAGAKIMLPSGNWGAPPYFQSSGQTLGVNFNGSVAHGLGVRPLYLQGFLLCISNDHGWSAGQVLPVGIAAGGSGSGVSFDGIQLAADATNVSWQVSNGITVTTFGSGGSPVGITYASWQLIIIAKVYP